ncbi:MAG: hypothetical protein IJ545_02090 [Alphaproteobacteria bacterium]|nr:hypothetical protein [Alphaproteobacteria bacterium]
MEIIAELKKPCTDKERADFIVEYNHQKGYEIQETDEVLLAIQPDPYVPTDEEQRQKRANAYAVEVDPITAHIQRLRDENPAPEGEIAELIAEREAKVEEIKERYPYLEK